MGCHRAAWTTALAIAIALLAAGSAAAFQFKSCVSGDGSGPCAAIGNTSALNLPSAIVVSPDGRHVYSAAFAGDAIGVFARDPSSGALSFQSCISANGLGPCTIVRPGGHVRAMNGIRQLAFSPDGRHIYAAAGDGDAISYYTRNADSGALTFAGCRTTNVDAQGVCVETHSGFLDDPRAVAVSLDGDVVYLAGDTQSSVGAFARNDTTGVLGDFHCLGGAPECADVPHANAVLNPSALAVSPDGRFLYSAARSGDAIARFGYDNATDTLSYLGCVGATAAGGCTSIGNTNALEAPSSLVVSPDGAQLFVAARGGNAVGSFTRDQQTGALAFTGCDGATNLGPCTAIGNGNALTGPGALAAASGRVYVAAQSGNAIGNFAQSLGADPLAFIGCVGADASGPCTSANNTAAFSSPSGVASSPDGRHLYASASGAAAIAVLGISPPACSPVTTATPFQTAVRVQLSCGEADGDAVGFAVGGAANGTLSELNGSTVLFTPNPGFFGQGVFDFSAADVDGASVARATINVGGPPAVPPPVRVRRLDPPIRNRWAFNRTHTWILRLQVLRVPGDARVQVRCKAPKRFGKKACPFKRKSAKPKRHRATVDVRKKMFRKKRKLRAGVQIQIRITAPGAIGKVVTYKLRPKKLPRSTERCLPPGATKPQKTC